MSDTFNIICDQRRTRLTNATPPIRFELTSPYDNSTLTKKQLDMRRKVEILKYSSNKMATQTKRMTQREYLAQLLSGNIITPQPTYDTSGDLIGYQTCAADKTRPLPTNVSGIPGPVEYLYEDSSVPLYNYLTGNRTYPFDVIKESKYWSVQSNADTLIPHNTSTGIVKLFLKTNIDKPIYKFQIITPVSIFVFGTIANNNVIKSNPITIQITYMAVDVYFSGHRVKLTELPLTLDDMVFDVSGHTGDFRATQYLGNLGIYNLELMTEPGYNYDINLIVRMSISGQGISYFSNIQSRFVVNTSLANNIVSNCNLISTPMPPSMNN